MIILLLLCLDLEITKRLETLVFWGYFTLLNVLLVLGREVVDRILGRKEGHNDNMRTDNNITKQILYKSLQIRRCYPSPQKKQTNTHIKWLGGVLAFWGPWDD